MYIDKFNHDRSLKWLTPGIGKQGITTSGNFVTVCIGNEFLLHSTLKCMSVALCHPFVWLRTCIVLVT